MSTQRFMKKILINKSPWETKAAIIRDNSLQNIFFSSHSAKVLERCFFKGVITKILPGIQTAFVDIGQEKAGFLHISEIDRDLAIEKMTESSFNLMKMIVKRPPETADRLI